MSKASWSWALGVPGALGMKDEFTFTKLGWLQSYCPVQSSAMRSSENCRDSCGGLFTL